VRSSGRVGIHDINNAQRFCLFCRGFGGKLTLEGPGMKLSPELNRGTNGSSATLLLDDGILFLKGPGMGESGCFFILMDSWSLWILGKKPRPAPGRRNLPAQRRGSTCTYPCQGKDCMTYKKTLLADMPLIICELFRTKRFGDWQAHLPTVHRNKRRTMTRITEDPCHFDYGK
jgi:hypothetical protein